MGIIVFFLILILLIAGGVYLRVKGQRAVPHGQIGLVTRTRYFARPRLGEVSPLVSLMGGTGPQARVLRANQTYYWLPFLYEVTHVDQTYIKPGTIGLVHARVGKIAPPGARLAPFTECDHFQDGAAFLREGGCQGLQMQVLTSGRYDINPHIFDVITIDSLGEHAALGLGPDDLRNVEIRVGETGVVITHLGATGGLDEFGVAPRVAGHDSFQCPWAFLEGGGQLGVQAETLTAGGTYAINPLFAHVVRIPTRNLVLDWSATSAKKASNLDAGLDQVELDVQGYTVRLNMKQILRIPEQTAPRLVGRFGDQGARGQAGQHSPVQQFVEKELATSVTAYFRKISAHTQILEFITKYDEIGAELSREVRDALAVTGIEAVTTSLDDFECVPDDMNELRRDIALERHRLLALNARLETGRIEIDIQQMHLELEAARRRLELVQIEGLVQLLGPAQVATERILAEWAKMQMPQTLVIGGGNDELATSILQSMPFNQARDMLLTMAKESGRQLGHDDADRQEALESAGEA